MANDYLTTTEVAVFNDADFNLGVSDVLDGAPLVQALAARTVMKDTFKYSKKTANPSVGFRSENDGRENDHAERSNVTVTLGILDASFTVDWSTANSDERGWSTLLATEARDHLRAAFAAVESQLLNGTVGGDANGFSGLADQTNLDDSDDAQVIDAGGTTASTGSSCYVIRSGPMDLELVWGQQGVIEIGESYMQRAAGTTGFYPALYTPITGWCGLKVGSIYSAVRIANLTEDSGKGLTDDLIADAISEFPSDRPPTHIVMNRRSLKQLQQSRTATNATGAPAPFPMEAFGYPIVTTDRISSTEALLTAA